VQGGGEGPSGAAALGSKVGNKMNNLMKKFDFLHSAIFKILRK
jgi:hypothetical protein